MVGRVDVPISPGLVERVAAGLRYVTSGDASAWNIWFGPGAPPLPQQPEVGGRQFDFPTATNMQWMPRADEPVGFQTLRSLADGYDLLRLVITTRKDQLAKLEWTIKPRDPKAQPDDRCLKIEEFLQKPDRVNNWDQWNRSFWEEVFVPDTLTILPRRTIGGDPYSLDIIDGTTIKPIVGLDGRRPLEGAAYQQIIKGIPVADFTPQDLYYRPHEVRAHKVYGFSKTEQVITTINIALRRQLYQLQYYTEGSRPDLIFSTPKDWSTKQTKEFAEWWGSTLNGNTAQRRQGMFVPEGVKPIDTKENALKDAYDEWLARIICYCFSVPPQALVKEQNRATAGTQKDMSKEEGLLPLMKFQKGVMDGILADFFGAPDLQFCWTQESALNPEEQAKIDASDIASGIRTINEIRTERGLEPIEEDEPVLDPKLDTAPTAEKPQDTALNGMQITGLLAIVQAAIPKQTAAAVIAAAFPNLTPEAVAALVAAMPVEPKEPDPVAPPPPPGTVPTPKGQPQAALTSEQSTVAGEPKEKLSKGLKPIKRDTPSMKKAQKKLQTLFKKWQRSQIGKIAAQVTAAMGKLAKGEPEDRVRQILEDLGFKDSEALKDGVDEVLRSVYSEGGQAALNQLAKENLPDSLLDQVNELAVEWAEKHSAELITGIEDATREFLRGDVAAAINEGLSTAAFADQLQDSYAFSDARAETIARTEMAAAAVEGTLEGYRQSGVVEKKEWIVAQDEVCEECDPLDGVAVGLDEDFPEEGGNGPPLHPNCRCDVLPVLDTESESEKVLHIFRDAVSRTTNGVTAKATAAARASMLPEIEAVKAGMESIKTLIRKVAQTTNPTREVSIVRDPDGRVLGAKIKELRNGE